MDFSKVLVKLSGTLFFLMNTLSKMSKTKHLQNILGNSGMITFQMKIVNCLIMVAGKISANTIYTHVCSTFYAKPATFFKKHRII